MSTTAIPKPQNHKRLPATYQAAVVHDFGHPLTLEQVDMPALKAGQVRVKVEACGLSTPTFTPRTATGRSSRHRRSFPVMRASASSLSSHPA